MVINRSLSLLFPACFCNHTPGALEGSERGFCLPGNQTRGGQVRLNHSRDLLSAQPARPFPDLFVHLFCKVSSLPARYFLVSEYRISKVLTVVLQNTP